MKSHTILTVAIDKINKMNNEINKFKLNFVDLASSEKSKKPDKSIVGLQTLNKVFMALADFDKKNVNNINN